MTDEIDHYTEIARRLLNEFIEMKLSLDRSGAVTPHTQEKERKKYERELKRWTDANLVLKESMKGMMDEITQLEHDLLMMERERDDAKRKLNEYLMGRRDAARAVRDFPLDEHMTQEAYAKWQEIKRMMSEVPYRGEKDDGS